MSKGWESKNVEEQQAEAASRVERPGAAAAADRAEEAKRQRRIQELAMQRERILTEKTANPHRRNALQEALATIERDLELLGWSIKL